MAYLKRQVAIRDFSYPEITPVTERGLHRRPVRSSQRKQSSRMEVIFYMAINAALLFGLIQCGRALVSDALALSRLTHSQNSVAQFYRQSHQENRQLRDKIRLYSSASGIEEMARNYLNMVGENEIPVRFQ